MDKAKEIAFSDVSHGVDEGVAGADALRADKLDQLLTARQVKEKGLKREQARLTQKLGAGHPRVLAIAERMTTNAGLRRDLALESSRARMEIPSVDAKAWVLFGVVRDAALKPVAGVTVALYDKRGAWIDALGYACTDDSGQFRIVASEVGAGDSGVFARVLSSDGGTLYVDSVALVPAGGRRDYREIILSKDVRPCAPPPGGRTTRGPVVAPDAWTVRGRVTDSDGNGLADLTVAVSDKDGVFADRLGTAKTDGDGQYALTYRGDAFHDVIERNPDLFVTVRDANGEGLFSSTQPVHFAPGHADVVNAQVERRRK